MKIHTLLHLSLLNKLYISALMPKILVYFECIFECISVFSYKYTHKYTQDTHDYLLATQVSEVKEALEV